MLINETKLDSTVHDSDVYTPGFEIVRNDRRVNGRKGGNVRQLAPRKISPGLLAPDLKTTSPQLIDD